MLGLINSKDTTDVLKMIVYLSINDCDKIYIKKYSISSIELDKIIEYASNYGVSVIFDGMIYGYNLKKEYDLKIKMLTTNIDPIIEIKRLNIDECILFKDDEIIYYNLNVFLKNKLCLIIDNY